MNEFESFMAERFPDSIYRRRCLNGDGNDYMSWDMNVARVVWNHLQQKLDSAQALAAERRQFILNGVEMGFIRLPDESTNDPATATYQRCLLKEDFSGASVLNSVRAEGVDMFAEYCDGSIGLVEPEDEELYTLMEEAATAFAARLRAGDADKDGK